MACPQRTVSILALTLLAAAPLAVAPLAVAPLAVARADEQNANADQDVAAELQRLAAPFRLALEVEGTPVPLKLHQPAILNFIDLAREREHSRLWMWTTDGRPAAFLSVSLNSTRQAFEAASISEQRVVVTYGDARWDLHDAPPVWRPLPADYAPSANPRLRLIQLKRLAARFTARETQSKDGVHDLRLMPAPAYRAPATETAADVAVFIFAYGTNAEVILCLESAKSADGFAWRYSLASLTAAEFNVSLDGEVVWTQPKYKFFGPSTRKMYVSKDIPGTGAEAPADKPREFIGR